MVSVLKPKKLLAIKTSQSDKLFVWLFNSVLSDRFLFPSIQCSRKCGWKG
jgi:hypothetical protein